jgi:hypothetical protein
MQFFKKNFTLVVAVSLPVIMIVAIALAIHLPRSQTNPQHDFIYSVNSQYPSSTQYRIIERKLQRFEATELRSPQLTVPSTDLVVATDPILYVHDTSENTSKSISFEEAQKFSLDPGNISPDGFKIARGNENFSLLSMLFGGRDDYNTHYLTKGNTIKELNLATQRDYYYDFNFLGWVIN